MRIKFTKMQAFGNDYIYINTLDQDVPSSYGELAKHVSDIHYGIGSDGMVLICPSETCEFRMRMFNPDGSEGEMCGNALRSTAKYVYDYKMTDKTDFYIETFGGNQHIRLEVTDGAVSNITANIGKPVLDTKKIPILTDLETFVDQPIVVDGRTFYVTAVSWGNPHCVTFLDSLDDLDIGHYGPAIENLRSVFPNRTNVTFAQVVNDSYLKIREWERGTGETIGCGTGCCTAVTAGSLLGLCKRTVTVEQVGGPLSIRWEENGDMFMTGPSHYICEGEIIYEAGNTH